jgi:cytochrome c oxidase subunit 2
MEMEERTSTLLPPRGSWWRPLGRDERLWVSVAAVWAVSMFVMILFIWPRIGDEQATFKTYRVEPAEFHTLTNNFISRYQTGQVDGVPVVSPPPGSDVYIEGSRFMWRPIVQLEQGQTYRFLLSSADVEHGFSLQPDNVNFQVLPGYILATEMTPHKSGRFTIICNEFCGLGHHVMVGRIEVMPPGQAATPPPRAAAGAAATTAAPTVAPTAADITIEMKDIKFVPNEFEIPAGKPVTVLLKNTGAAQHDFSIDALKIQVGVAPGESKTITINAPAGTYDFYCNVPGHKEGGMTGTMKAEAPDN